MVRRPGRADRRDLPRLRRAASARSACSTSTTSCSTGGPPRPTTDLGATLGGRDRPRLRRRVPGRQRAPGRHRRARCAAPTRGSPSSATTRRRSTASAAPARATCSTSTCVFPGIATIAARPQLPLDAAHPRRRQRGRATTRPTGFMARLRADASAGGDRARAWCAAPTRTPRSRRCASRCWPTARRASRCSDQAVLVRAAHHSDLLELELSRRRIPYVKYGGLRFLEAAHVKDLVCLFRLADNPRDELSWFRLLQLVEGVGPVTARRAIDALGVDEPGTAAEVLLRWPLAARASCRPASRPARRRPRRGAAAARRTRRSARTPSGCAHALAPARRAAYDERRRPGSPTSTRWSPPPTTRPACPTSPPTSPSSRRSPPATSPGPR